MKNTFYFKDRHSYYIGGDNYHVKDQFKEIGGKWEPTRKLWVLPRVEISLELIRKLRIPARVKVLREAFCHEPETLCYYNEDEIELVGGDPFSKEVIIKAPFCGNCDSLYKRQIVEVKRLYE